jgi:hypothetical protein
MLKCDFSELRNIEITPEGFLKARVTFAVPGVFPYVKPNGLQLEAKLPADILSNETIQSAKGVPITDGHPKNNDGKFVEVTPENYQEFSKGNLSEPHIEFDEAGRPVGVGLVTIYDIPLIQEVLSKKKVEVSVGFTDTLMPETGTYNGVEYDAVQKNIRINHLACVEHGRAGETKIHIDHKEVDMEVKVDETKLTAKTIDGKKELVFDSKELFEEYVKALDEIKARGEKITADAEKIKADEGVIDDMKARLDSINPSTPDPKGVKEKDALTKEIEALTGQLEAANAKLAALEEKYKTEVEAIPEAVDQAAAEKVDLMQSADALGVKCDGLSSKEIRMIVIGKYFPFKPEIKVDELDEAMIRARYDAAVEIAKIKTNRVDYTSAKRIFADEVKVDETVLAEKKRYMSNPFQYEREKLDREKK